MHLGGGGLFVVYGESEISDSDGQGRYGTYATDSSDADPSADVCVWVDQFG